MSFHSEKKGCSKNVICAGKFFYPEMDSLLSGLKQRLIKLLIISGSR